MAANLKRQIALATATGDRENLHTLLLAAENIGIDPFDLTLTNARLKYAALMNQSVGGPSPTLAMINSIKAAAAAATTEQATTAAGPGRPSYAAGGHEPIKVTPGAFSGSNVIREFDRLDEPTTSKVLGVDVLSLAGAPTSARRCVPSARALNSLTIAAAAMRDSCWGSSTHPWSTTSERSVTVSSASSRSASPPDERPAATAKLATTSKAWEASPIATHSAIYAAAGDGGPRSPVLLAVASPRRLFAGPSRTTVPLYAMVVRRLWLEEGARRRSITSLEREALASLGDDFYRSWCDLHNAAVRKGLKSLETEEREARVSIFNRYAKLASQLHRDFVFRSALVADVATVLAQEREGRDVLEMQQTFYFSSIVANTSRQLTAAISDWRRTVKLVELERETSMLDKMATHGWGESQVPLLQRRPLRRS